jgi:alkaline phosphatase
VEEIMQKKALWTVVALVLTCSFLLSACGPTPEPQVIESTVIVTQEVEVEKEVVVTKEVEVEKTVVETVVVEKEVVKEVVVEATAEPPKKAKYIFLFIGDGMGVAQRNSTELYKAVLTGKDRPEEAKLVMNTFPAQGMNTVYDLKSVIPDSAATGTALATGHKTWSGVISMDAEGQEAYETIAEVAKDRGMKVGIVSSVSIDHATPAVFYAHQPTRSNYREIGEALVTSDFDYFAGGPLKRPTTSTDRETELPDLYEMAKENGFTVAVGKEEFDALKPGVGKAFAVADYKIGGEALYYTLDDVPENDLTIVDFTKKGIELLDNPDGFFLMVEGGKIDWAGHANDAAALIHDTLALDDAIAEAYEFYKEHPDETLIVVTGDHETGGMTIGFAGTQYSSFMDKIQHQKVSYDQFNAQVTEWREAGDVTFEDTLPTIEEQFGLVVLSEGDKADLQAKAEGGDYEAEARLGMALSDLELETLMAAFERSMLGEEERANDEFTYLMYGGYEPYVVNLTQILNQKAGLAWTSYSHTGVPVPTSAIGVGAEQFVGYYDQPDIHTYMMNAAGF